VTVRRVVPDLHAADATNTVAFYETLLGMRVLMDLGWVVTLGSVSDPTVQLTVMTIDATAPETPDLTVEVGDIETIYARALAAGVTVVYALTREPWGVRRFFVRDPDGVVVNVMEHDATGT
jgi:catechol 2,3-dioxygenase-like lactoylglutathione lyase family enzyme